MPYRPGNAKRQARPEMRLVLDNTVMSNFALVGCTDWLRELWPGMLVTDVEFISP